MDSENTTICEKCGATLSLGDWPMCPHGRRGNFTNFRDEIPGGLTVENYGPKPITFYNHSERRLYMNEHGLIETERFSPFPGTDKDPQGIPNPAGYVDAKTLENGRILMTRGRKDPEPDMSGVLRGQFNITGTQRDAIAVQQGNTRRSSRIGRRIKDA